MQWCDVTKDLDLWSQELSERQPRQCQSGMPANHNCSAFRLLKLLTRERHPILTYHAAEPVSKISVTVAAVSVAAKSRKYRYALLQRIQLTKRNVLCANIVG